MVLHDALHFQAYFRRGRDSPSACRRLVDALDTVLPGVVRSSGRCRAPGSIVAAAVVRGRATEHDEVEQRIRTKPVCAMNRNASRLAHSHQAWNDRFGSPHHCRVTTSPE